MKLFNYIRLRYGLFMTWTLFFQIARELVMWSIIIITVALFIDKMLDDYDDSLTSKLSIISLQVKNQQAEKAIVNCLNGYFIAYYLDEHGKRHSIGCTIDEVGA